MNIYIINLKNQTERRAFQQRQFKKLDLDCEFLEAVTANDIDEETYKKHYYDWYRPLRKAEIACYFSHQKCWQKVISTNTPALILEDDAILSKDTKKILNILKNNAEVDLVDFEIVNKKKHLSKTSKKLIDNYQLSAIYFNSAGAGAYLIHPSGAQKLLNEEAKKGIAPTDHRIKHCQHLKSFQIEPALSIQPIFLEYYGLENKYHQCKWTDSTTSVGKSRRRPFVFRLKRIIAQIKLGFYKLWLLSIANKRSILFNKEDFNQ